MFDDGHAKIQSRKSPAQKLRVESINNSYIDMQHDYHIEHKVGEARSKRSHQFVRTTESAETILGACGAKYTLM